MENTSNPIKYRRCKKDSIYRRTKNIISEDNYNLFNEIEKPLEDSNDRKEV